MKRSPLRRVTPLRQGRRRTPRATKRRPDIADLRVVAFDRAGYRCEAWWPTDGSVTRCVARAAHAHHRMTKARDPGHLLDQVGDAANLAAVCPACHARTHDRGGGFVRLDGVLRDLLVTGAIVSDTSGRPVYVDGTDPEYRSRYPQEAQP